MFLCKVMGSVTAPRKQAVFETSKMLIVQRVHPETREVYGADMLALDPKYGAGVDDVVIVAKEGAVVAQLLEASAPANVIILGVVDDWTWPAT